MPQFIQPQNQTVDVLQQMGQQMANAQQNSIERSRINAAQFLKDFRSDCEKAGLSMAECAKKNQTGLMGALYSLSGNNSDVATQKYQELLQAPENWQQKRQRLMNDEVAQMPDFLNSKTEDYQVSEEVKTGTTKPQYGTFNDLFPKLQKSQRGNARDMALDIFTKPDGSQFSSYDEFKKYNPDTGKVESPDSDYLSPQAREWIKYRKGLLKAYGVISQEQFDDPNYSIQPEDNTALYGLITSGKIPQALEKHTEYKKIETMDNDLLDKIKGTGILRGTPGFPAFQGSVSDLTPDAVKKDPKLGDKVRSILDEASKGNMAPLRILQGWSEEELSPYLMKTTQQPYWKGEFTEKLLPDVILDAGGKDTYETKTSTKTRTVEKGFAETANDMLEKLSKNTFTGADLIEVKQNQAKAEADLAKSKTEVDRNIASANLMKTQALQLLDAMGKINSPDVSAARKEFYDALARFQKQYPPEYVAKMTADPKDPKYQAYMAAYGNLNSLAQNSMLALQAVGVDLGKSGFLGLFGQNIQAPVPGAVMPMDWTSSSGFSTGDLGSVYQKK